MHLAWNNSGGGFGGPPQGGGFGGPPQGGGFGGPPQSGGFGGPPQGGGFGGPPQGGGFGGPRCNLPCYLMLQQASELSIWKSGPDSGFELLIEMLRSRHATIASGMRDSPEECFFFLTDTGIKLPSK